MADIKSAEVSEPSNWRWQWQWTWDIVVNKHWRCQQLERLCIFHQQWSEEIVIDMCNCAIVQMAFCLSRPSDESCEPQNHQRMNNLQIDESWSVNEVWCLVCRVNHKTEREYIARKKTDSYPDQWWPYPLLPVSRLTLERCVLTHSRSNLLFSISIEFFHTSPGQLRSLGLFTSGAVL